MGKQQEKKAAATTDKFFVFGIDGAGKPRGARFAEFNERALSYVNELKLTGVFPASPALSEIAARLPPGRLYSSGKAFIANIRRDLVEKLEAVLATADDNSQKHRPAQEATSEANSTQPKVQTTSPITFGLRRSSTEQLPSRPQLAGGNST